MNFIRTTLKIVGWGLLVSLAALLTWANWEEKPLHADVKPVNMAIFKVDDLQTVVAANDISQHIERIPGVAGCAANSESRLVVISYYDDEVTEIDLKSHVQQRFKQVSKPSFESEEPTGPQCPVPAEYILKLEQFKYALCFR